MDANVGHEPDGASGPFGCACLQSKRRVSALAAVRLRKAIGIHRTRSFGGWFFGHDAFAVLTLSDSSAQVDYAIALTDWVFNYYSAYSGIRLTPAEYAAFASGLSHQTDALGSHSDERPAGLRHRNGGGAD